MSSTQNRISYDNKFDVLYFSIIENHNSYGDEIDDNIVLMKDIDTKYVTGITVMGFMNLYKNDIESIQTLNQYFDINEVARKCLEISKMNN